MAGVCCRPAFPVEVGVSVKGQPQWVVDAVLDAQEFWAVHNVDVQLDDDAAIDIRLDSYVESPQCHGTCYGLWEAHPYLRQTGTIVILSELDDSSMHAGATMAHEIGHAIDMDHVPVKPSLMSPTISLCPETGVNGICWSGYDQDEFCRVHAEQCE